MSGFNYARAVQTADRLIKRFGQVGKLRRYEASGTKANPGPKVPVDVNTVFAVVSFDKELIDGTRILFTDKLIYLSAKSMAEDVDSSYSVIAKDGEYKIITAKPLNPGGIVVFWKIQARR